MNEAVKRPDIEITRKMKNGWTRSYGHLYWKPFIVAVFLFHRSFLFRDKKLTIFNHNKPTPVVKENLTT